MNVSRRTVGLWIVLALAGWLVVGAIALLVYLLAHTLT